MASLEKPRKSRKPLGTWGNCRKELLEKPSEHRKRFEKSHAMEARQCFEKARNIEASIFKKPRVRSSTESSVRWGSEQDGLQLNSSVRWGSKPGGLQGDEE